MSLPHDLPPNGRGRLARLFSILTRFDDGRYSLAGGALCLLVSASIADGIREMGYEPLWGLHLFLDVLRDFGIAAFVAGVVSLGIERISRSRFQEEITKELHNIQKGMINSAYMKHYPPEYADFVEHILDTETFYRLGLKVDIDLVLPDDQALLDRGIIYYDQRVSYRALNISGKLEKFEPRVFLDKDSMGISGESSKLLKWAIGKDDLTPAQIAEADQRLGDSETQKWYVFPKEILVDSNKWVEATSKVRNIKYNRDVTTWCGLRPADGIQLTVRHPPNILVYVQVKSPARSSDIPAGSDGTAVVVNIFTPLLPYTTVEIGWRPAATGDGAVAVASSGDTVGEGLQPRA